MFLLIFLWRIVHNLWNLAIWIFIKGNRDFELIRLTNHIQVSFKRSHILLFNYNLVSWDLLIVTLSFWMPPFELCPLVLLRSICIWTLHKMIFKIKNHFESLNRFNHLESIDSRQRNYLGHQSYNASPRLNYWIWNTTRLQGSNFHLALPNTRYLFIHKYCFKLSILPVQLGIISIHTLFHLKFSHKPFLSCLIVHTKLIKLPKLAHKLSRRNYHFQFLKVNHLITSN